MFQLQSIDDRQRNKHFIIYKVGDAKPLFYQKWGTQASTLDTLSSIGIGIARIVPISYGTGSFIARLLMPDSISASNPLTDYGVLEQLVEEVFNQDSCYKFKHTYDLQQDIRFIQKLESKKDAILNRFAKKDFQDEVFYWFRKKDLLLVKVEFYRKTTTYTSDYTWIIKPQMNALLSQAVLQPSIRLKE